MRGPVTAPLQLLLTIGFEDAEHHELAEKIATRFRGAVRLHGPGSTWNPLTGDPAARMSNGARKAWTSWASVIYLILSLYYAE